MIFLYILLGIIYCVITCVVFLVELFNTRNNDMFVVVLAKAVFWWAYAAILILKRIFNVRRR